jgi:hypothetical protein
MQVAGGGSVQGDTAFTPEVYIDDSFHPICLAAGDNSVVAATCAGADFPDGGYLVDNLNEVYAADALLVKQPQPSNLRLQTCSYFEMLYAPLQFNPCLPILKMDECEPGETVESCAQRSSMANVEPPEQCRAGQPAIGMACNYQASNPPFSWARMNS